MYEVGWQNDLISIKSSIITLAVLIYVCALTLSLLLKNITW
jgi:hypothetical protein